MAKRGGKKMGPRTGLVPGSNVKGIGKMGQYRSGLRPGVLPPQGGSTSSLIGLILGGPKGLNNK